MTVTMVTTDGITCIVPYCNCYHPLCSGKIPVDVAVLGVDYLTLVGHKFYGPRIGALYHRLTAPLVPLLFGGGQERNMRPGTENTPMIAG